MNAASRIADQWFTLDRDWTVVECGDAVPPVLRRSIGMNLWEAFPGSEEHFRDVYECAWECGMATELIEWNGDINEIHAWRRDDVIVVSFDYVTIAGLRDKLDRMTTQLSAALRSPARADQRHLSIVR